MCSSDLHIRIFGTLAPEQVGGVMESTLVPGVDDYEVKVAYSLRDGRDVRCGWDLFECGYWAQRFQTKWEATEAKRQLQESAAKSVGSPWRAP